MSALFFIFTIYLFLPPSSFFFLGEDENRVRRGICLRTLYLRDNHVVYLSVMHMTRLNHECCMNFIAAHDRCRLGLLRQEESFTTIELAVSTLGSCHEENENKVVFIRRGFTCTPCRHRYLYPMYFRAGSRGHKHRRTEVGLHTLNEARGSHRWQINA